MGRCKSSFTLQQGGVGNTVLAMLKRERDTQHFEVVLTRSTKVLAILKMSNTISLFGIGEGVGWGGGVQRVYDPPPLHV